MTDMESTVQQIFSRMAANFDPQAAKGLDAVIQFNLTGDGAAQYHAIIKDGTCRIDPGTHASPSMTLTVVAKDYADMVQGRLDGMSAFMSGKLQIAGDMSLAMRMQSLFRRSS